MEKLSHKPSVPHRPTHHASSSMALPLLLLSLVIVTTPSSYASLTTEQFCLMENATLGRQHSEEYCAMYDICGKRRDGKKLNCPCGSLSVKPDDQLSMKIQSLCPTISGNICCSEAQFDTLRAQVQPAIPFLIGCPACLRNFLNLFCELTCSPNQSQFINVTSVSKVNNNLAVNSIDFYVTDTFGEELYNSCKEVKFGTMNTRAMEFIAGGAKNFKEWFAFIGRQVELGIPGSPYAIDFKSTPDSPGIKPMNVSVYSCGDTSLGCSCGDCPSSPSCSNSACSLEKKHSCSIKIGSLKVKCIEFSLGILYIGLVSAFLGCGMFHRQREMRNPSPRMKSFLNLGECESYWFNEQKDEYPSMQMPEEVPRLMKGIQVSIVQGYISSFYRMYGTWVARNPTLVLCSSLAIVILFCLGLTSFKVETQPEKHTLLKLSSIISILFVAGLLYLWAEGNLNTDKLMEVLFYWHGSKAAEEKLYFDTHLAPFYRIEQLILATIPDMEQGNPPSIVTEENINLLFEIQQKVDAIRANYSGSIISLTDICLKPLGQDCATQSLLQYFKMNPKNYDDYGGVGHIEYCFQHYTSAETCRSAFQSPLDPRTVLGGFSGANYSEASAFVITYPVNNEVDQAGSGNGKAVAWEQDFIELAKEELLPMVQSRNLTISFSSESSVEEELKRESTADAATILVSYILMFAYISLTLGDVSLSSSFCISSKLGLQVLLGFSGVILVMLAVLGSIGFFSAIGVKSTLIIMEVIPFLVLAVGVDNMCILVHAVKRQPSDMPLEGRISNALVEVGPSITLASLSEILAFTVGSFIPMPACRVFSLFAALAVFLDFLLQVTAFVALIIFDFLRTEDDRVDCFPCIKVPSSNSESDKGLNKGKPGLLAHYMKEIHAPILGLWGVKIAVVIVFVAFAFTSITLCTRIEPGLEQRIVLPRDSYLQIARASTIPESSYVAKPAASWLDDFLVWMSPEAFGCCRKFTNGSYCPPDDQPPCCLPGLGSCSLDGACRDCTTVVIPERLLCFLHSDWHNNRPSTEQFKEKLPWFLNALPSADCSKGGHGAYTSSLDLNDYENGVIQASEFRTYHTPLNKQSDFVNAMRAAREFSSRISDSLQINVGNSLAFILKCSLWSSAIILLVLAMVVVDLMGVMAILNIQLNAISVVNLVMSIGIAIEFCVHIIYAFLASTGDRESRMKDALSTMGASVFSGITLTKLIGVIVLHFARSEVFVVYYFQMYLALLLIGFLHGLVFLPVVLSICGPPSTSLLVENKNAPNEKQEHQVLNSATHSS
ncbi:hypothetical protein Syun_015000 [Stephania yunnanensis]|uniref:SSD domain-containing protein n=1 Tax=Stephania yunnanensis TaxID=152371 RepID=A0AAP0PCE2_9MAGN